MRSLQLGLIPDDENGEVLKRMVEDGDDLTLARPVEFFHVFAEEEQANAFASAAAELPSVAVEAPEVDEEDEVEVWQVCVIRVMAPSHAAITALEGELGALAETLGGFADGWGCSPAERPH